MASATPPDIAGAGLAYGVGFGIPDFLKLEPPYANCHLKSALGFQAISRSLRYSRNSNNFNDL